MEKPTGLARIKQLEAQLADLQARLPAHSIPPSMMIEMDELEEELAVLYARYDKQESAE
jgi:RNA binding exosome subunit